jgi:hypothetical protein
MCTNNVLISPPGNSVSQHKVSLTGSLTTTDRLSCLLPLLPLVCPARRTDHHPLFSILFKWEKEEEVLYNVSFIIRCAAKCPWRTDSIPPYYSIWYQISSSVRQCSTPHYGLPDHSIPCSSEQAPPLNQTHQLPNSVHGRRRSRAEQATMTTTTTTLLLLLLLLLTYSRSKMMVVVCCVSQGGRRR